MTLSHGGQKASHLHRCLHGPNSCGSSISNSPCVDQADAQPLPVSFTPRLPAKVTGTSEPVPATKSMAGAQGKSMWDVREVAGLVQSRGEGVQLHLPPPKGVTEQTEPGCSEEHSKRTSSNGIGKEIPRGFMELIPAISMVQPCDWGRQEVISVLGDGHSSPGRGPQQPALPLKPALLSAGVSRGTTQAKSCCNLVTMQSLAAGAVQGRGTIPGDTGEFQ